MSPPSSSICKPFSSSSLLLTLLKLTSLWNLSLALHPNFPSLINFFLLAMPQLYRRSKEPVLILSPLKLLALMTVMLASIKIFGISSRILGFNLLEIHLTTSLFPVVLTILSFALFPRLIDLSPSKTSYAFSFATHFIRSLSTNRLRS